MNQWQAGILFMIMVISLVILKEAEITTIKKRERKIPTRGKRKNWSKNYSDHAPSSFRFLNANELPTEAAVF